MKLNMKKGICTACHFKLKCTLTEPFTAVWNCSEYEEDRSFGLTSNDTFATDTIDNGLRISYETGVDRTNSESKKVMFH